MKSWPLDRRVHALSEKLKAVSSDVVRIDVDSLSEPEKQLFNRIWEIQEEYGSSPPADVLEENLEFFIKAYQVIFRRVLELFLFAVPKAFGWNQIEEWYFKLHFYNFFENLSDCLKNVSKWSEKDREEFLRDMKESGMMDKVFRIPRESDDRDVVKSKSGEKAKDDD